MTIVWFSVWLTLVRERWLSWTNIWCYGSNEKQTMWSWDSDHYLVFPTFNVIPFLFPVGYSLALFKSTHNLSPNFNRQLPVSTWNTSISRNRTFREGSYVPVPPEFLQGVRKVCDKQCWLWLEFKVEMGSYVVIEESGVKPDVLVMARVDFFWSIVISELFFYVQGLGNRCSSLVGQS